MKTIGIRTNPNEIYYAVLEQTNSKDILIISCTKLIIPVSLIFPEKLNFVRKTFKDIILEYEIENAGIRITEPNAQSPNLERIAYEAIIQELFANSSVNKYLIGQISNISAKIGF